MAQINFRVDDSVKLIMDILARSKGKSVAQIAKEYVINNINTLRVDLAFDLLKKGNIGRKKAWKISGLEYSRFLIEWRNRGAEEMILEDTIDDEQKLIDKLITTEAYKRYLKHN